MLPKYKLFLLSDHQRTISHIQNIHQRVAFIRHITIGIIHKILYNCTYPLHKFLTIDKKHL